ncbi:MAG: type IV secretory system conjugative DNA transfer family protein [Gammaproteobacteria bacterium]
MPTQRKRQARRKAKALPLPKSVPDAGLLVAWSLEHEHRKAPVGFIYGDEDVPPSKPLTHLKPVLHTACGHLMTIAPTGAGKGIGSVIPTLLRYPGPVVVIDPKGENYAVTKRRREELGNQVVLLDPFNITGDVPSGFNPLDVIDGETSQGLEDAMVLSEMLVPMGSVVAGDRFWNDRARSLIFGLILHCATGRPPVLRNLSEVRYLLNQSQTDLGFTMKEMQRSKNNFVQQAAAVLNTASDKVGQSIVSTAQSEIDFLIGDNVNQATSKTGFDLDGITRGDPISVFIVIPPDKLEPYCKLLRIWIGMLFSLMFRRRSAPKHRTLLILDEAAQLGELPQLRQAITLLRGYGIQTWSFWQDLSQIQRLYPKDWETMYNNCRVHQIFGVTTLHMARTICELNWSGHPLDVLGLDADEMILSIAGDQPVIAQRPNYLTDPVFQGLADRNPLHHPPEEIDAITARHPQRHFVRAASDSE